MRQVHPYRENPRAPDCCAVCGDFRAEHPSDPQTLADDLRAEGEALNRRFDHFVRRGMAAQAAVDALVAAARGEPTVGAIAVATRQTGVCDAGERGVCYEVYELKITVDGARGTRPGYSFIFQSGRYDGFSPDDVRLMLTLTGEVDARVAGYQFRNVMHLVRDFARGVFDAALRIERRTR